MCNLYSLTKSQQAIRELAKVMVDQSGNVPPMPAIFPDHMAPVVATNHEGARTLLMMRWGVPPPPSVGIHPITNIRNTKSSWWKPWLSYRTHRCLIPATSFCEYDHRSGKAVPFWYALHESRPLFFFAGIWRVWHGTRGTKATPVVGEHLLFAFLTTEANADVRPVHEKAMPVLLLTEQDRELWMTGTMENALTLQKPAPDGSLKVVATGRREDP